MRRDKVARLLINVVGPKAQEVIVTFLDKIELRREIVGWIGDWGYGFLKGYRKGREGVLLEQLAARFGKLPAGVKARIKRRTMQRSRRGPWRCSPRRRSNACSNKARHRPPPSAARPPASAPAAPEPGRLRPGLGASRHEPTDERPRVPELIQVLRSSPERCRDRVHGLRGQRHSPSGARPFVVDRGSR
jgi:hypothetical protein